MRRFETSLPNDLTQSVGEPSTSHGFSGQAARGVVPTKKSLSLTNQKTRMITTSIRTNTEFVRVAGENFKRNYLMLQNSSTNTIYISLGSIPSINQNTIELPQNTVIAFDAGICPNNEIYAVSLSPAVLNIIEGVQL